MPFLFHFAQGLPDQATTPDLAYGPVLSTDANGNTISDQFRVTSSFQMTGNEKAYAILPGTILLQKQTTANKVNLILKPSDLTEILMPVKYIIYRGGDVGFLYQSNRRNGIDRRHRIVGQNAGKILLLNF